VLQEELLRRGERYVSGPGPLASPGAGLWALGGVGAGPAGPGRSVIRL